MIPLQAALMGFEDFTLAANLHESSSERMVKAVVLVHCCTIPVFVIILYEAGYLVHKRRSVTFCGIKFEEKQRVIQSNVVAGVARFWIRILALVVLILGFVVNTKRPRLVGYGYFLNRLNSESGIGWYPVLALVPPTVLAIVGLWISLSLWIFGTTYAMTVHATCFNGWGVPFVGSLVQVGTLFVKSSWFPAASSLGEVALLISVMYAFR